VKLQLLSDLHLETEAFDAAPAPGAELLVLAGDIDSTWAGYERFRNWPVPVLVVLGNHEFDGRDIDTALAELRAMCASLGFTLLERKSHIQTAASGEKVRFVGCTRWCDFDLFGPVRRAKAERAAAYFMNLMRATRAGRPFDTAAVRAEGLAGRAWLEAELAKPVESQWGQWDRTVCITHFAPSLRSADPRYGHNASTASFCNADDDLIPRADLWLHGHLHCRHAYTVARAGRAPTQVLCNARGLARKGENEGWRGDEIIGWQ
jgi:hypothetical protein